MKDNNGDILSDWCTNVKLDLHAPHCTVCHKTFSIADTGLPQILSHADSAKHKSNIVNLKGQAVFKAVTQVSVSVPASASVASPDEAPAGQSTTKTTADVVLVGPKFQSDKAWVPISLDAKVTKAEILLALKLVSSNYSFNSYGDIGNVCKTAFLDFNIAQYMELGSTKVSYLIVHSLAPYFRTYFMQDLKAGIGYFTIYFDKTTTRQIKKRE